MEYCSGTYEVIACRVMGRSVPFESLQLQTSEPLEKESLHFIGEGEKEALKLLPLIRLRASPETAQNACYYYNRKQGGQLRFVSYHFEGEPEVLGTFSDTASVLEALVGTDSPRDQG
jgi:hypothetical protein